MTMTTGDMTCIDPARVGGEWVWPDGTRLPVVSGASDIDPDMAAAMAEAPMEAPAAPAAAPAPTGAPERAPGAPEGEPDLANLEPEKLRELAAKWRKESEQRKERFRPWEETFSDLTPGDQEGFLRFIQDLKSGDQERVRTAAEWMRGALDQLSPAQQAMVQAAAEQATPEADEFDPYDQDAIKKLIESQVSERVSAMEQERRLAEERQQLLNAFDEHAAHLAEEHGLPDMGVRDKPLYDLLFLVAKRDFSHITDWQERLDAAAESIANYQSEQAKSYLQRKSAAAEVPAVAPAGEPPAGQRRIATLADARSSADERLKKLMGPAGR